MLSEVGSEFVDAFANLVDERRCFRDAFPCGRLESRFGDEISGFVDVSSIAVLALATVVPSDRQAM